MSVPATLKSRDGREATLNIMHALHCFMSRVSNVGGLDKYKTDHGRRQLRASIVCLRPFLEEQLDAGEVRTVTKLNERIFDFSVNSAYAQHVANVQGIEPFEAILHADLRLPTAFHTKRFPQMRERLAKRRGRW